MSESNDGALGAVRDAELTLVKELGHDFGLPARIDADGQGLSFLGTLQGKHEIEINFVMGTFRHRIYVPESTTWKTVAAGRAADELRAYLARHRAVFGGH
jgi:hypothetical protein